MIAVMFEVEPREGLHETYLDHAARLRPELEAMDGFVSVERFESLTTPGKLLSLSLSLWRDEAAVAAWRNHPMHRETQRAARSGIFRDYTLRVAGVIRDYRMHDRGQAPADSLAAL
jgi:heme-degrading monooxygenase HmoA